MVLERFQKNGGTRLPQNNYTVSVHLAANNDQGTWQEEDLSSDPSSVAMALGNREKAGGTWASAMCSFNMFPFCEIQQECRHVHCLGQTICHTCLSW